MDTILDYKEDGQWVKNNKSRAKNAIIWLWISFGSCILSLIVACMQYMLLCDWANNVDSEALRRVVYYMSATGTLSLIIRLGTGIFFILWFRRAYNNLHVIGAPNLESSEGMAVGAWFIPIYNFWGPFNIMKDISHNTESCVKQNNPRFNKPSADKLLGWWWGFWVAYGICSTFITFYATRQGSIENLRDNSLALIISEILQLVAAPFCIIIIRRIATYEQEMMENEGPIHKQMNLDASLVNVD
jgi:hypothetical protein